MKPESAKKLEQKLRREWLAHWLPLIAIVIIGLVGLSLYAWWTKPDPIINEEVIAGHVTHWSQPQSYDVSTYRVISVELENGKTVQVVSRARRAPINNKPASISKRTHESGRTSYQWLGQNLE